MYLPHRFQISFCENSGFRKLHVISVEGWDKKHWLYKGAIHPTITSPKFLLILKYKVSPSIVTKWGNVLKNPHTRYKKRCVIFVTACFWRNSPYFYLWKTLLQTWNSGRVLSKLLWFFNVLFTILGWLHKCRYYAVTSRKHGKVSQEHTNDM